MSLCQCGCGQKTKLAPRTDSRKGWIKNEPMKFIAHHHSNKINRIHPKAINKNGTVKYEHILIAEKVLGSELPDKAVIHHVDGDRQNNTNSNLVICQDQAYHMLLHTRARAYKTCGHANWRKCPYCKKYDDPKNLCYHGKYYYHRKCQTKYKREKYHGKGL